uniref:6-phosphofructo-2-kinase domain-containing protein n=2 Tax=Aureoumbra lagunensis TaxID=44058 RepID=A0A7S3JY63_9STRA
MEEMMEKLSISTGGNVSQPERLPSPMTPTIPTTRSGRKCDNMMNGSFSTPEYLRLSGQGQRSPGVWSSGMVSIDNPIPQKPPGGNSPRDNPVLLDFVQANDYATPSDKLVIVMVGLPARGKTFIARKLLRYLSFFHAINVRVFNISDYRRRMHGAYHKADWFDPANEAGSEARKKCSDAAMDDLVAWVASGNDGRVAILDGTHSTLEKRKYTLKRLAPLECKVIMIESICDENEVIEQNIASTGLKGTDYAGLPVDESIADFRERVAHYEATYQTLDENGVESSHSWIKIVNFKRFIINNIRGYLPSRIVQFVSHLHTKNHVFYLCRHGQSEYNVKGKIGGDSGLSGEGDKFARALADFADKNIIIDHDGLFGPKSNIVPVRLWTSTMRRTRETAKYLRHDKIHIAYHGDDVDGRSQDWIQLRPRAWPNLDELFAGVCDGMTYAEIEELFPEEFARRQKK